MKIPRLSMPIHSHGSDDTGVDGIINLFIEKFINWFLSTSLFKKKKIPEDDLETLCSFILNPRRGYIYYTELTILSMLKQCLVTIGTLKNRGLPSPGFRLQFELHLWSLFTTCDKLVPLNNTCPIPPPSIP